MEWKGGGGVKWSGREEKGREWKEIGRAEMRGAGQEGGPKRGEGEGEGRLTFSCKASETFARRPAHAL